VDLIHCLETIIFKVNENTVLISGRLRSMKERQLTRIVSKVCAASIEILHVILQWEASSALADALSLDMLSSNLRKLQNSPPPPTSFMFNYTKQLKS
jgi:hypothetical protein